MFGRFCSKHQAANAAMAMLLVAVVILTGADTEVVTASPQQQQTCGGTIQFGQTITARNASTWPHCDYWFQGKQGERITISVNADPNNGNLVPQIIIFDKDGQIIRETTGNKSTFQEISYLRLDRGDNFYGFRITSAVSPRTYGYFTVSISSDSLGLTYIQHGYDIRMSETIYGIPRCLYTSFDAPYETRQWTCDGGTNQWWTANPVGQSHVYQIQTLTRMNLCLDVAGSSKDRYASVLSRPCNMNSLSQQWRLGALINGWRELINVNSGLCLDLRDGSRANGAIIQQYPCVSTTARPEYNQLWKFAESFGGIVLYDRNGCTGSQVGFAQGYGSYNFTDGVQQQENGLRDNKAVSVRFDVYEEISVNLIDKADLEDNSNSFVFVRVPANTHQCTDISTLDKYSKDGPVSAFRQDGNVRGKVSLMYIVPYYGPR